MCVRAFKIKRAREGEGRKQREVEGPDRREIRPTSLRPGKSRPKTNRLHREVVRYASTVY